MARPSAPTAKPPVFGQAEHTAIGERLFDLVLADLGRADVGLTREPVTGARVDTLTWTNPEAGVVLQLKFRADRHLLDITIREGRPVVPQKVPPLHSWSIYQAHTHDHRFYPEPDPVVWDGRMHCTGNGGTGGRGSYLVRVNDPLTTGLPADPALPDLGRDIIQVTAHHLTRLGFR